MGVGGYVPAAAFISVIIAAVGILAIILAVIIAAIRALAVVVLAVFMFLVSVVDVAEWWSVSGHREGLTLALHLGYFSSPIICADGCHHPCHHWGCCSW